ncbi:MAG: hypothetical protein ACJ798_04275 [Phenylobacterium sp.]
MISYPPALRGSGFVAPKAVSRMGLAVMEARADKTERAMAAPQRSPHGAMVPANDAPPRRTVVRLWLPATLIFLLLAPFALLLSPLLYLVPRRYGVAPLAAVAGLGRLLLSLGGTVVDVDTPDALVRIRLF